MKLTYKKLILLFLYSPITEAPKKYNVPIQGRTRLMKMGFLFKEELLTEFRKDHSFNDIDLPEFMAWKYGPFSADFLNDVEFLLNQEYILVKYCGNPITAEIEEYTYWIEDNGFYETNEYIQEQFTLSEKGISKAKEFWGIMSDNQKRIIIEFKQVLNRAPLSRILEYVYKKYEKQGYTDKSLIRERYLS